MTAVVRPVSIQNPDFCFSRITLNRLKVFLQELNVSQIHGKPHRFAVFIQLFFAVFNESFNNRNITRNGRLNFQSFRNCAVSKTAVYRVNKVLLNFSSFISTYSPGKNNHFCTAYTGRFSSNFCSVFHRFPEKRKTLFSRVSPLVVLTGKIFPDNYSFTFSSFYFFVNNTVALWFRKDSEGCHFRHVFRSIFNVIAVKVTNSLYRGNSQKSIDFR